MPTWLGPVVAIDRKACIKEGQRLARKVAKEGNHNLERFRSGSPWNRCKNCGAPVYVQIPRVGGYATGPSIGSGFGLPVDAAIRRPCPGWTVHGLNSPYRD